MTAESDAAEAKKERKAAKRAAAEAAEMATPAAEDADDDAVIEAKKLRKAAKRAAAAAAAEEELLLEAEAKKKRKAARADAMGATAATDADANTNASGDHFLRMAEAKKARKLAKRSAAKAPAEDGNNDEVAKHNIAKRSAAEAPAGDGNDEVDKQHLSRKQRKLEFDLEAVDKDNRAKLLSKGNKELEVVVLGLSPATASTVVRRDFAECGEIVDFRMPLNDEGGHKGIAFIEYKDAASCEQALKLGGKEYDGRFLVVRMATDASGKDGKGKGKHASKEFEVFVGGLPWDVTEERVRKDFSECGEILALRMPLTKSGLFQGTAFIVFADKDATDKAVKFNGTDYGGRPLAVRMNSDAPPPKDKGSNGKGSNELEVFVGGLPGTTTEHDIKELFTKCGEIVTLKMPPARETDTKRIAFIKFKEKDACSEALKFSDSMMGGMRINVRMSGSSGGKGKTKDGKNGKGKGKGKKGKK